MDGNVFTLSSSLWNNDKQMKFLLNITILMFTITTTVSIIMIVNQFNSQEGATVEGRYIYSISRTLQGTLTP